MASLRPALAALALLLAAPTLGTPEARAADPAITFAAGVAPARVGPGDRARLRVEIEVPAGWHLWSLDPGEGPMALRIGFRPGAPVQLVEAWRGPAPRVVFDRGFQRELKQYGEGKIVLERAIELLPTARPGKEPFTVTARGQICSEDACIQQSVEARLEVEIVAEKTGASPPEMKGEVLGVAPEAPKPAAKAAAPATPPSPAAPAKAALGPGEGQSVWRFLLIAFLAGLAALATPCVFPAIPLTVSFFSKFSEVSVARGARLATFYALMMIAFFTFAGVVMSIIFGVTGIQSFAAHPAFNLGLGLMLVFFSLNLLGWFDIQAPAFLLELTNKLEGKYGPNAREGGGLSDYAAVAVAAMTSTTVFFTCTVGFVGAVLVAAAQGNWFWPTLGMLAFSSAFVLPFFFLALFPQAAKRLRGRNGTWLTATRVCLGFIELAASIKFLSNADLVWKTGLISRSAALSLWVVLFGLCGLFLLGKLEVGEAAPGGPSHHISVPRMLLSALTLAFTLYLGAGLLDHRPLGWVDGWLPPEGAEHATLLASNGNGNGGARGLTWIHDLEEGRRKAGEACSLVFVNYTGITCTNCRFMESSVFSNPRVAELLNKMTLVELITDGGEPQHELARTDQVARFGTAALPLYSIEKPDGTRIARFESSTNDPEEFRRFLADAMQGKATAAEICARGEAEPIKLETTRLADKRAEPAAVPGKWSLINFWATWCGPCRDELTGFLAAAGKDVEARGGRFAAVAVESTDTAEQARAFMEKLGVPPASALFLDADKLEGAIDKRLGFDGADLPFTALVSPEGKVVWNHRGKLEEAKLKAVLTEHMGLAALR